MSQFWKVLRAACQGIYTEDYLLKVFEIVTRQLFRNTDSHFLWLSSAFSSSDTVSAQVENLLNLSLKGNMFFSGLNHNGELKLVVPFRV